MVGGVAVLASPRYKIRQCFSLVITLSLGSPKNESFGPKKDNLNGFGYLNPLYLGTKTLRAVQYSYQ